MEKDSISWHNRFTSVLRFNKVVQTLSKKAMHKALMQFQINYSQQCSFWHPVVLWLNFSGLISPKSFPVVCVPARMEHTRMWFCYMLFMALSLPFLPLKLSLPLFCLDNIVHLLFLGTTPCSVVSGICHFFLLHFHLSLSLAALAYTAPNVSWTQKS